MLVIFPTSIEKWSYKILNKEEISEYMAKKL